MKLDNATAATRAAIMLRQSGAKKADYFSANEDGTVTIAIPGKTSKLAYTKIMVTLDLDDTYTTQAVRISRDDYSIIWGAPVSGIYCDTLAESVGYRRDEALKLREAGHTSHHPNN